MKHIKTFESYTESLNEGISSNAKALMSQFEDCVLVSDYYEDQKAEELDTEPDDAAMKELGTTPETTVYASAANDEIAYDKFMKKVQKSGLKYVENTSIDGFPQVFISGK